MHHCWCPETDVLCMHVHASLSVIRDCHECITPCLQVLQQQAQDWCQALDNTPYFETSARDAVQVEQAFTTAAQLAMARYTSSLAELEDKKFEGRISVSRADAEKGESGGGCAC
eukprot:m.170077 g.170077  ORF g.170077 m.170077 type:complete len:114 (+) comp18257_c1_seq2:162-503(+)